MLPSAFLDRMKIQLGKEYDAFLDSYADAPSIGLRVNTLKISPTQFSSISPYPLTPISWTSAGFTLPEKAQPGKHPYHVAGLYYLQDPSAMAVTELLDPQPGERVLDLAAAPGGKTTHIAAKMEDQGLLVANDVHPRRVRVLCNHLERWGVRSAIVLNETPPRLAAYFGAYFDKVLVDAPCSGEGMFRKDPSIIQEWTPELVESYAARQDEILRDAARLVRPGGRLVYSTCTFSPEEDEGTILRFLQEHPAFEVETAQKFHGFSSGRPEWLTLEHGASANQVAASKKTNIANTVRIWPHKAPGEGHFIAVLHCKTGLHKPVSNVSPFRTIPLPKEPQTYFAAFVAESLGWDPPHQRLSLHGSYLYLLPDDMPDLNRLRVVHWGWWLGTLKVKRFEPAHALAMALSPADVRYAHDLSLDDLAVKRYIRGEVLPAPGPNGWVLIAVDGYPLGWAKRVQNRLKSRPPRWLRETGI